jgi:uncharacterized protein (DUF4213/DUF364 family)
MILLNEIMTTLQNGRVVHVNIGLHWTAVQVDVDGNPRCGLATTLHTNHQHGIDDVTNAGTLEHLPALEVAKFVFEPENTMTSVGMAAVNALIPQNPSEWVDLNAEDVIAEKGCGKSVVLIGHFPFVPRLEPKVGELTVLELEPRPGDLPASTAQDVIPSADVLAITSMTLLNHTLENLLKLVNPKAYVIMLGPTTPLSPILYDYGINTLCGVVVSEIDPVLAAVRQGANFRQVHRAGVRLVSITQN